MSKLILFGGEAKEKIMKGVELLSKAVGITLGPKGRTVLIGSPYQTSAHITKDGVTVANNIVLEDIIENEGAKFVREVASKTNEIAGDGTTTATILASSMIQNGYNMIKEHKSNPNEVKKGIDIGCKIVTDHLTKCSKPVGGYEDIANIGSISANNNREIGELIANAIDKVGHNGVVTIESGNGVTDVLTVVEGMQIDRGYVSPYFITDGNTMKAVLDDPFILFYDRPISQLKDISKILEEVIKSKKSILIIADGVGGEALSTLTLNKMRGQLKVCAVNAPSFGSDRKAILEDMAILTGGAFISDEVGYQLQNINTDQLGKAKKVIVDSKSTIIIDGLGDGGAIQKRIEMIKKQIEICSNDNEKIQLRNRLAKLTGGVAVISVGAMTETEMREKKDRVEDALNATKSAIEEGVVVGGGTSLINCIDILTEKMSDVSFGRDVIVGMSIVRSALKVPFETILSNFGLEEPEIMIQYCNVLSDTGEMGFDAKEGVYCNLFEKGIIDPVKVTRNAIMNACSIAGTLLTMEVVLVDRPKDGSADFYLPKQNNVLL